MDISVSQPYVVFKTPYNEKFDLCQFFRGFMLPSPERNFPIDFMGASLQKRGHIDLWHTDISLAVTNDEATPPIINGEFLGANHGYPFGVAVTVENHGYDYSDVGSLWEDEKGMHWTLLKIINCDVLLFLSDNIGKSEDEYEFAKKIAEKLTYISHGKHTSSIAATNQRNYAVTRIIRHLTKELYASKDGVRQRVLSGIKDCDYGEFIEEYEILNPATISKALREARPENGYTEQQPLSRGKALAKHKNIYRVEKDGTVMVEFTLEPLGNINLQRHMGIMYQEKCDLGGSIFRYIPKSKPFIENDITFDFSKPRDTWNLPFPKNYFMTEDAWENPDSPPDRQIDFLRKEDGSTQAAFAGGYLPLYDGKPEIRKNNINFSTHIYHTRKTYPCFAGGEHLKALHGVAYKKYFPVSCNKNSYYSVNHNGKTYLYIDIFEDSEVVLPVNEDSFELMEKSDSLSYELKNGILKVFGPQGYFTVRY